MEPSVMNHIFESQIMHVYGKGKKQTTRIAAISPKTGELEEHDVRWFKTDFSRPMIVDTTEDRKDRLFQIVMDVPGMTNEDIRLSRQNVTTIVKGVRPVPYSGVLKVERSERTYGDFTQTFKVPQEYERKWASVTVVNGVLKIVFKPDTNEEGLAIH